MPSANIRDRPPSPLWGMAVLAIGFALFTACSDEAVRGSCAMDASCAAGQRCDDAAASMSMTNRCLDVADGGADLDGDEGAVSPPDGSRDVPVPMAGCATDDDCAGVGFPACDVRRHRCVECVSGAQCSAPHPFCDGLLNICVGCRDRADCPAATPACDQTTQTCLGCIAATDCPAAKPACDATTHSCVACLSAANCAAAAPVCDLTTQTCVACLANSDCAGATPVCDMAAKSCVGCLGSADCLAAAPICDGKVCRACKTDAECVAKSGSDPGVCMSHQDGRCASDSEAIYVKNGAGCSMAATAGGSSALPFCLSQMGADAVTPARRLIVMRGPAALSYWSTAAANGPPLTVVGQNGATIAPGAFVGIHVTGAEVFARDLRVVGGASIGIAADGGATLRLQHVEVDRNAGGGILLDGAAFAITNTVLSTNGPGTSGAISWGGMLVQSPPAAGPAQLNLVTITANKPIGLSCSSPVTATGVLSTGNTGGVDILPTCAITSCAAPTTNCGAAL